MLLRIQVTTRLSFQALAAIILRTVVPKILCCVITCIFCFNISAAQIYSFTQVNIFCVENASVNYCYRCSEIEAYIKLDLGFFKFRSWKPIWCNIISFWHFIFGFQWSSCLPLLCSIQEKWLLTSSSDFALNVLLYVLLF